MVELLLVFQFVQSLDGRCYRESRSGVGGPGTTGYYFHAATTAPEPHSWSLHFGFATEGETVLGMLAYLNFPSHFLKGYTIMGPLFADSSDLGVFSYVATK